MTRPVAGAPSLTIYIPEDAAKLVDVEADADRLLDEDKVLGQQFAAGMGSLLGLFPGTARIQVSALCDPEDDEAVPHLVAELECGLERRTFRERRKQFFRALRDASCLRLHDRLTVLQF